MSGLPTAQDRQMEMHLHAMGRTVAVFYKHYDDPRARKMLREVIPWMMHAMGWLSRN